MLHHGLLKGLIPTADHCMFVLLSRYRVLRDQLLIDQDMKENAAIGTDCFLKSRINPIMHVVACITRTVKRVHIHSGKESPVLFVTVPSLNITRERIWLKSMCNRVVDGAGGDVTITA